MYRRTNIACKSHASKVMASFWALFWTLTTFPSSLTDELPSTIKALNDGWLTTYQISTIVVRAAFFTWYTYITHTHVFISLTPKPGSAIRNSRGQPPLLHQRRIKLLETHQQIRTTRPPRIHLQRAILLPKRHRQRTHPHGRIRRTASTGIP